MLPLFVDVLCLYSLDLKMYRVGGDYTDVLEVVLGVTSDYQYHTYLTKTPLHFTQLETQL